MKARDTKEQKQHDETIASLLRWAPWFSLLAVVLPLPVYFFLLFLSSTETEMKAINLLVSLGSLAVGTVVGLILALLLFLYRRRWLAQLRDKLAADGITAGEVKWFLPELTTTERETWQQLKKQSPLLADAYCETLAARLMAARLIARSNLETRLIERRISKLQAIQGTETAPLQKEIEADRNQLQQIKREAAERLREAKARLEMIEATASRDLNRSEKVLMLQRLNAAHEHPPLSIEINQLEQQALLEAENEVRDGPTPSLKTGEPVSPP